MYTAALDAAHIGHESFGAPTREPGEEVPDGAKDACQEKRASASKRTPGELPVGPLVNRVLPAFIGHRCPVRGNRW